MTTQQQAYIEGFVKRANQYGFSNQEALSILKQASELKGNQHKLDVDKDGKIEASDLRKLRQRKQAGFLSEGYNNAKQMVGNVVDAGKQLATDAGNAYNSYVTAKNTATPEDLEANKRIHGAYIRDMNPGLEHKNLPPRTPILTGGSAASTPILTGGSAASRPVLNGGSVSATPFRSPGGTTAVRPTSVR